jgi:hypothetical protein
VVVGGKIYDGTDASRHLRRGLKQLSRCCDCVIEHGKRVLYTITMRYCHLTSYGTAFRCPKASAERRQHDADLSATSKCTILDVFYDRRSVEVTRTMRGTARELSTAFSLINLSILSRPLLGLSEISTFKFLS